MKYQAMKLFFPILLVLSAFWFSGAPLLTEASSPSCFPAPATYESTGLTTAASAYGLSLSDTCYADTSICPEDTLRIGGLAIAGPGTYILNSGLPPGCETALVLNVTERDRYELQLNIDLCHGENARFGAYTFGRTGFYQIRLPGSTGCDTFIYLDLLVSNIGYPSFQIQSDDGSENGSIDLTMRARGLSFQWSNGATTEDLEGLAAGEYTVTVTNADSCRVISSVEVKKLERFKMPSAFTPNGDGINDYFNLVVNEGAPKVTAFRIFNRWGQLVYDNDDPERGWDGTFRGQPQASDTYFYYVQVERQVGPEEALTFQGDVVLLR